MAESPTGTRSGRRRDAAATREAILEAATGQFAQRGYEQAGLRAIAAEAGVTAALVNRYFGTKEGLFAEVVGRVFDSRPLVEGDRSTLADRLARLLVFGKEGRADDTVPLLLLLRSATEPRAAALLREVLDRRNLRLLAEIVGGPDADARAALIMATLTGFAMFDRALRPRGFAEADRDRLVALLGELIAACLPADA